jgi:hypothetical protein
MYFFLSVGSSCRLGVRHSTYYCVQECAVGLLRPSWDSSGPRRKSDVIASEGEWLDQNVAESRDTG